MALAENCRVRLVGLQSAPELNGITGTTVEYVKEKDRWRVVLDDNSVAQVGQGIEIKAVNLTPLGTVPGWDVPDGDELDTGCCPSDSRMCDQMPLLSEASHPDGLGTTPSNVDSGQANELTIGQLQALLEQWQSANLQWQVAYSQLNEKFVALEMENRDMRAVIEAAESGPDMNHRFIARMARQNWRLGQEAAARGVNFDSSDAGDGDDCDAPSVFVKGDEVPEDTGRDRRPVGVNRLPFRKDETIHMDAGAPTLDSGSSSATDEAEEMPEKGRTPVLEIDGQKLANNKVAAEENAVSSRGGQDSTPQKSSSRSISSSSELVRLVAAALGLSVMAVFAFGHCLQMPSGGSIEL